MLFCANILTLLTPFKRLCQEFLLCDLTRSDVEKELFISLYSLNLCFELIPFNMFNLYVQPS